MSFFTDVLLPPPFFVGPLGEILQRIFNEVTDDGKQLFGTGEQPDLPPPPQGAVPPSPDGQGPTQEKIDELTKAIADIHKQLEELHKAGEQATDDTGLNSNQGRTAHDQILGDGSLVTSGLTPQGLTPEADAGRLAAMQQQIDELTKNVEDRATTANGIADSLRNLGMGLPGAGMPGLGGAPSLGMPGLGGGMPGISPLGGPGLGEPPSVSSPSDDDFMEPPEVSSTADDLNPPSVDATGTSAQDGVASASPAPAASAPDTAAPSSAPSPTPATPAADAPPPAPEATSTEITLPSGQVVTAPNPQAAAAVRNALSNPAGAGDVATTAYDGTGVEIPTDGADPGRKVDPTDVKPGDVVVFDDHTAIVAGNGQLIGPDGKLQPLGVINDMAGFQGIFRPTEPDDAPPTPAAAPGTEPVSPSPVNATTVMAQPATTPPPAATESGTDQPPPADAEPGFGLPAESPHER